MLFGEKLQALTIRRANSVDNHMCKYLTEQSPFKNLKFLDLSYNQIDEKGLFRILNRECIFATAIKKVILERNVIVSSLPQIIKHLHKNRGSGSLAALIYLDLNLNQVNWQDEYVHKQGYKVVKKFCEKKMVNDCNKIAKIRSQEISLGTGEVVIKLMDSQDMYKTNDEIKYGKEWGTNFG